jgi:hypothetical protein
MAILLQEGRDDGRSPEQSGLYVNSHATAGRRRLRPTSTQQDNGGRTAVPCQEAARRIRLDAVLPQRRRVSGCAKTAGARDTRMTESGNQERETAPQRAAAPAADDSCPRASASAEGATMCAAADGPKATAVLRYPRTQPVLRATRGMGLLPPQRGGVSQQGLTACHEGTFFGEAVSSAEEAVSRATGSPQPQGSLLCG